MDASLVVAGPVPASGLRPPLPRIQPSWYLAGWSSRSSIIGLRPIGGHRARHYDGRVEARVCKRSAAAAMVASDFAKQKRASSGAVVGSW